MRLPLTPPLDTRDGVSAKNARLTNCLKEVKKSGEKAVVRPGLVDAATSTGNGYGLVRFNDELVSVYGSSLGVGIEPATMISSAFYNIAGVQLIDLRAFSGGWIGYTGDQIYHTADLVTFTPILTPILYELDTEGTQQTSATNGTVSVCSFYNTDTDATGFLSISTAYAITEIDLGYTPYMVMYNGTKFCGMETNTKSVTSTDGTTWTSGTTFTGSMFNPKIAWNGTVFCLTGGDLSNDLYARTSSDGLVWTSPVLVATSGAGSGLCWAGDRFVVSGLDWVVTSTDGVTWTAKYYPFPYNFSCKALAYNSSTDTVLAIGSYSVYGNAHTKMVSTDNGATWIDTDDVTYNGIEYIDCVSDGTGFIATGSTVLSGAANNIEVISEGTGATIATLATVTGTHFDFAQSPL